MTSFIRLSKMLINASCIQTVRMHQDMYYITMQREVTGWMFVGSGIISSHSHRIEICKQSHEEDYKVITEWIEKQK